MTADVFDPEAIAARVELERARERETPLPPTTPYTRNEGSTIVGTGEAHGLPVPTEPVGRGEDTFAYLERVRAAKEIRSPFGDHDRPNRYATDTTVDPDRYVAPDLNDDEEPEDVIPDLVDYDPQTPAPRPASRDVTVEADTASPVVTVAEGYQPAGEQAHDPRCGQPLTGGGAPRGWVLIRIIGQGTPRRYCGTSCAVTALTAPPERTESVQPRTPSVRTTRRSSSGLDVDEIVRRYQAGETAPQIGRELGHTAKTIRDTLDKAGIQRRDDRRGHSGGQRKEYDQELVDRVRALYELHRLPQAEVAEAIGCSVKVVANVMAYAGIQPRPPANSARHGHPIPNNAKRIHQRLTDLGLTSRQVKEWALQAGLIEEIRCGSAPEHLIDAYLAAHQNGDHRG